MLLQMVKVSVCLAAVSETKSTFDVCDTLLQNDRVLNETTDVCCSLVTNPLIGDCVVRVLSRVCSRTTNVPQGRV